MTTILSFYLHLHPLLTETKEIKNFRSCPASEVTPPTLGYDLIIILWFIATWRRDASSQSIALARIGLLAVSWDYQPFVPLFTGVSGLCCCW